MSLDDKREVPQLVTIARWLFIVIWLGVIVSGLVAYIVYPDAFTPESIALFLSRFQGEIWAVYVLISAIRGFTLLPSTPLVIAGTLLFPTQPLAVLAVSLVGILLSSSLIYFFSDKLGFRYFFEKYGATKLDKIKSRLERRTGVAFVALWAFFPLVPTDLVCYAAGIVRMHFAKFITAIFAGELILCSVYVFLGNTILTYVH
jgi:uncharacterized membrane protein YdjX (TVP38/TMEM64 family)